jgi:hypothetical protein
MLIEHDHPYNTICSGQDSDFIWRRISSTMVSDKQETSYTLVFGVAGILIAFTALLVAYMQLRRTRPVHHIYELA